jgi:hypothetical protein
MSEIFIEASNLQSSDNYYIQKLYDIKNKFMIKAIYLDVDRGIDSLEALMIVINEEFQNLQTLTITQNYFPNVDNVYNLIEFLTNIKVKKLEILDQQSEILKILSVNMLSHIKNKIIIIKSQPHDDESKYKIKIKIEN